MQVQQMRYKMTMLTESRVLLSPKGVFYNPTSYNPLSEDIYPATQAEYSAFKWDSFHRCDIHWFRDRIVFTVIDISTLDENADMSKRLRHIWFDRYPTIRLTRRIVMAQFTWRLHVLRRRVLVVAMGLHPRLGVGSRIADLTVDLVQMIYHQLK